MQLRRWTLGLLGAALAGNAAATAGELSSVMMADNATVIVLSGDIEAGDNAAAEALIKGTNDDGRLVSALRLDSPGGSLAEAIKLADLIRRAKLPTIVAGGSRCASACFIVFAAGVEKFASYDAAIGVHGVSDRLGRQTAQTEAATLAMARIASTFGVPSRIVRQMVATRPDDIAWLSPNDLRTMGAIMTDRSERAAPSTSADEQQLAALGHAANLAEPPTRSDGSDRAAAAAAERGIADARFALGIAYALGRGVVKSLPEAHFWLDLAAASYARIEDRSRAIEARELVAAKMTDVEIAEAQRLARERH